MRPKCPKCCYLLQGVRHFFHKLDNLRVHIKSGHMFYNGIWIIFTSKHNYHFTSSLHNKSSHHFTTSLGSTSSHHLFTIGNSTSQHLFNTLHDISQAWPLKDEYHFQLGDVVRQFNFCSFRINLLSAEGCPQVDVFLENLVDSPSKTASTDGHPQ